MNKGIAFMGMGFELAAVVLGGIFIGGVLEKHFGWTPGYGMAFFIVVGMLSWLYHLIVLLKRFMAEDDPSAKPPFSGDGPPQN